MNCRLKDIPSLGVMGIVLHKVMQKAKTLYKEFDLNRSQASILFTLHNRDAMSQKELASSLNVTPPSITSSIQKMEKDGYLTRHQDEADQRVMRLTLTEKGRECVAGAVSVASQMDELMFRGMNTEEKLLFRRLLMQIYENLEQEALQTENIGDSLKISND